MSIEGTSLCLTGGMLSFYDSLTFYTVSQKPSNHRPVWRLFSESVHAYMFIGCLFYQALPPDINASKF